MKGQIEQEAVPPESGNPDLSLECSTPTCTEIIAADETPECDFMSILDQMGWTDNGCGIWICKHCSRALMEDLVDNDEIS